MEVPVIWKYQWYQLISYTFCWHECSNNSLLVYIFQNIKGHICNMLNGKKKKEQCIQRNVQKEGLWSSTHLHSCIVPFLLRFLTFVMRRFLNHNFFQEIKLKFTQRLTISNKVIYVNTRDSAWHLVSTNKYVWLTWPSL